MSKRERNRAAIYCRLSRDDEQAGDSMSIETQREMLRRYAKEQGFIVADGYVDDGWSGTSFDRPDFQRMKRDIEDGTIDIVLVKDLSRLGRNQVETSLCIQVFFPQHEVRFIAVSDNIDTAKGEDDFMELRNLFNEWFVRDTSRKVKGGYRQRALNGQYTGAYAPYGYRKSEADKHKLVPDESVAPVVQQIFRMALDGSNPYKIARQLRTEQILTPRAYLAKQVERSTTVCNPNRPCDWGATTVKAILQNKVYIGHMVSHKFTKPSYKRKGLAVVPKEEWIEVPNTHESLVDAETYELAQKVIRVKKRPTKEGEHQIFAGLLKCSTCGQGLSFARGGTSKTSGGKQGRGSFACNQSRTRGKEYCSFHYISYVDLYTLVLEDIQRNAVMAAQQADAFVEMIADFSKQQQKKQWQDVRKEQTKLSLREQELQTIIKKLYEDNALGRISDEQYVTLSQSFATEQAQIQERLAAIQELSRRAEQKQENATRFIEIVREHIDIQALSKTVLNELIDRIVVHDAVKSGGQRTQQVDIYYRFVGLLS